MGTGTESTNSKYKNMISEIIHRSLIDLYGAKGCKSIIETMVKICGKTEKEITTNYELFADLSEGVFGRLGNSKILDPIKMEIDKIGSENIYQEEKPVSKKPSRLLIADDEPHILELYKEWLEFESKQVVAVSDGQKCLEVYKKEFNYYGSADYFDVVILDHKMPNMTGLQAASEILKINPRQRIIFASGYLEKTLLASLTRLNRAIEVIEKPFSMDSLINMIDQMTIFEKLEKININQVEKDISEKLADAMLILKNQSC